jgi:6-phosphogluconolactonase
MPQVKAELKILPDAAALAREAAEEFSRCAKDAIAAYGRFAVALSGGNTPKSVYSYLAEKCKDAVAWDKVFVFFGDERHVPPNDPESNFRMANESLLSRVPLRQENVFRIRAELPAKEAAQQYEDLLRDFFSRKPGDWPSFDLILLGLGEDGHTASLFPGSAALEEKTRLVAANRVETLNTSRITLTLPVLNHAAEALFLVSGGSKAKILSDILRPAEQPMYPAQMVRPENGRLLWMADQDAASLCSLSSPHF